MERMWVQGGIKKSALYLAVCCIYTTMTVYNPYPQPLQTYTHLHIQFAFFPLRDLGFLFPKHNMSYRSIQTP